MKLSSVISNHRGWVMELDVGEQKDKYDLASLLPLLGHYSFKLKQKTIHKAFNYTSLSSKQLSSKILVISSHSRIFDLPFTTVSLNAPKTTTILGELL